MTTEQKWDWSGEWQEVRRLPRLWLRFVPGVGHHPDAEIRDEHGRVWREHIVDLGRRYERVKDDTSNSAVNKGAMSDG
jgi:hypothetical protein